MMMMINIRIMWESHLAYNECGYSLMHWSPMLTDHDVANGLLFNTVQFMVPVSSLSSSNRYSHHLPLIRGLNIYCLVFIGKVSLRAGGLWCCRIQEWGTHLIKTATYPWTRAFKNGRYAVVQSVAIPRRRQSKNLNWGDTPGFRNGEDW